MTNIIKSLFFINRLSKTQAVLSCARAQRAKLIGHYAVCCADSTHADMTHHEQVDLCSHAGRPLCSGQL